MNRPSQCHSSILGWHRVCALQFISRHFAAGDRIEISSHCHDMVLRRHWVCALQFISRPFVVGDRIEISSVGGGKSFVVGTVERVDPMRTIIRTDACMPITIPNKVSQSLHILPNSYRVPTACEPIDFDF